MEKMEHSVEEAHPCPALLLVPLSLHLSVKLEVLRDLVNACVGVLQALVLVPLLSVPRGAPFLCAPTGRGRARAPARALVGAGIIHIEIWNRVTTFHEIRNSEDVAPILLLEIRTQLACHVELLLGRHGETHLPSEEVGAGR